MVVISCFLTDETGSWHERTAFPLDINGWPVLGTHSWDPTGQKVAYTTGTATGVWVADLFNSTQTKIYSEAASYPDWSPDGSKIAFSLGACIYTKSLETAMRAMENIKAGSFWINDPLTDNNAAPFGGMRWSGIGRELGEEGLDAFREPKHVHLDYVMERKDYWFPYSDRKW